MNILSNSTTANGIQSLQGQSRCSGPASGNLKSGDVNGTNSLQNFKSTSGGAVAQNGIGSVNGSINLSR